MASVGHKRERSFLPIQPFNLGRHPRQILLFRLLSDALQYVCTTSELFVSFQVLAHQLQLCMVHQDTRKH